jgi:ferric-dicitrate binding protein FerR (iron transport regulator)
MNPGNEDDPAVVADLLVKAGRRAMPPTETREAVYLSTLVAWQQTQQHRRSQRLRVFALAAGFAAAALAVIWYSTALRQPLQVAAWQVGSGQAIRIGETLRVADVPGRVLQAPSGEKIRVATGSELVFRANGHLQLREGKLYVESASSGNAAGLVIDTGFGSVRHLGTRYAVSIGADQLTVSVRDGRVAVASRPGQLEVGAGLQVVVDREGREAGRQRIDSFGPVWAWTENLAPALAIDGRVLYDVLQEIAFETGRRLEFADDTVRVACGQIRLKGPFLDMPASDRLFAVLVTTGLEATESGDRIQILRQPAGVASRVMSH